MNTVSSRRGIRLPILLFTIITAWALTCGVALAEPLKLNDQGYFDKRGLSVLVFNNYYNQMFGDSKVNGIEMILHGLRLGASGDVRFHATPGQWDSIPGPLAEGARRVNAETGVIEVDMHYPQYEDFRYTLRVEPRGEGFAISVNLPQPVPAQYVGRVGLNFEFLPAAYFHKTYLMDGKPGQFPLHPTGPMGQTNGEFLEPQPIVTGNKLVLAPEDRAKRVTITSEAQLALLDGRNVAQNGWFVVRSLLPADKTGTVLEWVVEPNVIANWTREPNIGYSQVGYLPDQQKVAVIELDRRDQLSPTARVLKANENGEVDAVFTGETTMWGPYFRHDYATFDFSAVREPGVYLLEYNAQRTGPFRIDETVYEGVWHPTMDVFLPVQMDHMIVNEGYRTWHLAAHMDDALQAPTDHVHFDGWYQGPSTDTKFKPGEHIPGLAVGGWFDAGDFDIQTPSNLGVILDLVETWDRFAPQRDETSVDHEHRDAVLHQPDGVPDMVQQIKHGALQIMAQVKAVGHVIPGITDQTLETYTHLGDGSTQTDNKIYDPSKGPKEADATTSGKKDDRWAFTGESTQLNYAGAAALAGASRALAPYDKAFADECLQIAEKLWAEEQGREPVLLTRGVGSSRFVERDELRAAVQLLVTTQKPEYAKRVDALINDQGNVAMQAQQALRAMPFMDESFKQRFDERVKKYAESLKDPQAAATQAAQQPWGFGPPSRPNPYGVNVGLGNWAGNGGVIRQAVNNYMLYKAYPDLFDREAVFKGAAYLFGTHPVHNLSFVSGVGVRSKEVAYGNNRADFSFIAGGVVPGPLFVQPDFFESHEDWPFFWAQNEYTVGTSSSYVLLGAALEDLGREEK